MTPMKNENSEQTSLRTAAKENHGGLKVAISLVVLVGCWILWFIFARGWIIALGLSIVAALFAEQVGIKVLTGKAWFERLSVQHSGFSVWRIALVVLVVLLIFSVIIMGRLVFLKIVH